MHVSDSGEFVRRLVVLGELFEAKLSPAKQALYFEALRDLPFEAVARGLDQAARTCTFFPRPAELRALAVGDVDDAAEAAWMALRKAMARVGGYSSLVTSNPELGESILAVFGSWPDACSSELTPEMWASKRKEFGRVYRVLAGRQLDGARYLPGVCESQNAGRKEWTKFVPVAVLEADTVRVLEAVEAESYRTLIAATSHQLTRLNTSELNRLVPQSGEVA